MTAMIIIITIIIPTLSATLGVCAWFIWVCVRCHVAFKNTVSTLTRGVFFLFICMESRHDITSSSFCFS